MLGYLRTAQADVVVEDDCRSLTRRQRLKRHFHVASEFRSFRRNVRSGDLIGKKIRESETGQRGIQRDVARLFPGGFQGIVDDHAQEPWSKRTADIELLDSLGATQERIAHDVLRQLAITHNEVCRAGGLQLVTTNKRLKPTDVSTSESVDRLAFVGRRSVAVRHGRTIRQPRERFGYCRICWARRSGIALADTWSSHPANAIETCRLATFNDRGTMRVL